MQRPGVHLVLGVAISLAGCLSARVAHVENLEVPLPSVTAGTAWQADVANLLDRYEEAPVLAPEDQRLEPLYGGLSTLSYFGADAKPRLADQRIPHGPNARGHSLEAACALEPTAAAQEVFATSRLPAFTPLWIPASKSGRPTSGAAHCDDRGESDSAESFCMFGRLALQAEPGRPLIVVVHGIFDSGAQEYVQRTAAVLYGRGYSVLLPDMRDHGDTLRASPQLATTLGTLEGPDLLALVGSVRRACGARVGRAGLLGISAGGLDAIRAFTLDDTGSLDAGVIALSPLLDIPLAIEDLTDTGACAVTSSIELSWIDDLTLAAVSGAAFFAGAAVVQASQGEPLDEHTLLSAGIGFGAGLLGALTVDAFLDGGSTPCVSEHAIAMLVQDALRVRWRSLHQPALGETMSPAGRRLEPDAIDIGSYLRERAQYLAARLGATVGRHDAEQLAADVRHALQASRPGARLLVLGAADDPLTRVAALRDFQLHTAGLPQVYARTLSRGGHAAMWLVQPTVTEELVARFFGLTSARTAEPARAYDTTRAALPLRANVR